MKTHRSVFLIHPGTWFQKSTCSATENADESGRWAQMHKTCLFTKKRFRVDGASVPLRLMRLAEIYCPSFSEYCRLASLFALPNVYLSSLNLFLSPLVKAFSKQNCLKLAVSQGLLSLQRVCAGIQLSSQKLMHEVTASVCSGCWKQLWADINCHMCVLILSQPRLLWATTTSLIRLCQTKTKAAGV